MSIDIAAPPEIVFEHLVTVDGMLAWMGEHAVLDPVPGGEFVVDIKGSPMRGRYLEVERPRRVVVSWGIAGTDAFPPGSSLVTFTLIPTDDGTRLELAHTGLPETRLPGHSRGWHHFLERLEKASRGVDPGPDPWQPTAASTAARP